MSAQDRGFGTATRRASRWAPLTTVVAMTLSGCGGGSRPTAPPPPSATPPPVTQPPKPTTVADLSASVVSPQADTSINCTNDVNVRITLVNRGGTPVTVSRITGNVGIATGRCFGGGDFSVRPRTSLALPNTETVVYNQSLFPDGPGCCDGRDCGSSCRFLLSFEVLTDLGSVPAGSLGYTLFYQNCRSCTSSSAAGASACSARPTDGVARDEHP